MTDQQARRLGELIRRGRNKKELSLYALADLSGIDPARIDALTANHLADSLPSVRTYFRSKTKATPEQLDAIEAVLREIHAEAPDANADDHAVTGAQP